MMINMIKDLFIKSGVRQSIDRFTYNHFHIPDCILNICFHYTITLLQVFDGISDKNTPVKRMFPDPVSAESIRIHPTAWHGWIAVRFEVLECDGIV